MAPANSSMGKISYRELVDQITYLIFGNTPGSRYKIISEVHDLIEAWLEQQKENN